MEYYDTKYRKKFKEWYKKPERQNYVFNFKQEILRYCRSDVDILRRCCLEFREISQQITDVDPFIYTYLSKLASQLLLSEGRVFIYKIITY